MPKVRIRDSHDRENKQEWARAKADKRLGCCSVERLTENNGLGGGGGGKKRG